jgi:hypothetical protein
LHHKNRIWVALEIHRWVYLLFVARKGRAEEGIVVVVVSESFFCFGVLFVCLFGTKFGECREILEVLGFAVIEVRENGTADRKALTTAGSE